mmetsp:Transcript_50083/g.44892  ORF Transcript_50083/g.44892 Transcript_50083/m.44892 type:complete len:618 (-) Transcript_50083:78-1931(-)
MVALLVGILALAVANAAPPLGFLPNIIIFYADDYGWGDMESYGHPMSITPNLDRLAKEGTKLTAFYSSSPVCSPSRAALLTGRFQTRTGIWPGVFNADSVGGLPESEITIAKFLKMNGLNYRTAIVGKWHIGTGGENGTYLPTNRGFDFYTGIPYSHDMPDPPYCFPDKRGCWPATAIDPWNDTCPDSFDQSNFEHITEENLKYDYDPLAASQALRYKKRYLRDKKEFEKNNPGKKFKIPVELRRSENVYYEDNVAASSPPLPLYYGGVGDTHIVQQPVNITNVPSWYTNNVLSFINASVSAKEKFFVYMAFHQTHHPQFASSMFFNTSQRGMFGDAEAEMDYNLGKIMDYLTTMGVENETFVFFSSDNGPSLARETRGGTAGPLKCGKGTTWEGGQRVPGLAWMPGKVASGRVSRQMGSTLDMFPTIAELVDKPIPTDRYYDGYSMYDWLFTEKGGNGKSKRDTFYYWPYMPNPNQGWQQSLNAVRINQWKLQWITGGSHCPNYYADTDCRDNATETVLTTPKLFNLYQDVGEHYPPNVSQPFYSNIVKEVNKSWEFILKTDGLWAESEMHKGTNESYGPCCNWGCTPWPSCCDCDKINNTVTHQELFDTYYLNSN